MEYKEKLKAAGIDYDRGVDRFMEMPSIYEKLLKSFPADDTFERAHIAYLKGDMRQLALDVHELKGVSSNFSLLPLSTATADLVTLLRSNSYTKMDVTAAFEKIERAYYIVVSAIIDTQ